MVPQTCTREVEYTVCRMVPVTQSRTVEYAVCRMISEQHFRTVCQTVCRAVTEVGTRTVPYTTYQEVPVCRTVSVPRQVPRTVTFTVTRCVPRTECYQVPVCVCCPVPVCETPKGGKGCDGGKDLPWNGVVPPTPKVEEPKEKIRPATPEKAVGTPAMLHAAAHVQPIRQNGVSAAAFAAGLAHYRNGRFEQAAREFRIAMDASEHNAKYAYFRAVALHAAGGQDEANQALALAVEAEKRSPVANWGRVMERIQGQPRLWLEEARKAAGVSR